jgi:hypothetical protein
LLILSITLPALYGDYYPANLLILFTNKIFGKALARLDNGEGFPYITPVGRWRLVGMAPDGALLWGTFQWLESLWVLRRGPLSSSRGLRLSCGCSGTKRGNQMVAKSKRVLAWFAEMYEALGEPKIEHWPLKARLARYGLAEV